MNMETRYVVGFSFTRDGNITEMPYKCLFLEEDEELERDVYWETGKCTRIDIGTKDELLKRHNSLCCEDFEK